MAISVWKPGTLYQPQEVVVPQSAVQPGSVPPTNPGFESGDSDWTKGTGWAINNTEAFAGSYSAQHSSAGSDLAIVNNLKAEVTPGQSVTARCLVKSSAADTDANITIGLRWYTSGDVFVSDSMGNAVSGSDGWKDSKVTATCPGTAAKVSVIAVADNPNGVVIRADAFSWNHVNPNEAQALAFKNTNTTAGLSGATEPTWPSTVGGTVVDNEVTWEAFAARTVTWQASANLVSGATEPTWPIEGGAYVSDGTIAWKAIPYRIEDENCPNSKVVAIAASKIFAGDDDVMRFSATLNPRDWSTAQDAGFLPTGLQQRGQIGIEGAGNYRGNLCVWSASTFQMWQVDPDPANMALLDTIEGIGTTYYKAIQPVSNDLFFCAALGVRTVGLAAGSGSLQAGDVGLPVDSMIQPAVFGKQPISTYYPSAGQYWITTSNEDPVPVDPPLLLLCPLLDDAPVGVAYSYTPTVTNGSGVDLTFTISDGALPTGLSLDAVTGEISGTPTVESEYTFTLSVSADGFTDAECIHDISTVRPWFVKSGHSTGGASATADFVRSPQGTDWSATSSSLTIHEGVTDFYYIPDLGKVLGIRGSADDLAVSSDKGLTWSHVDRGVSTGAGNQGFAYNGSVVFLTNGIYSVCTSSDLASWDATTSPRCQAICAMGSTVYINKNTTSGPTGEKIFQSTDDGATWTDTGTDTIPAEPGVNSTDVVWVNSSRDHYSGGYSIYCITGSSNKYIYKFVTDVSSPSLVHTMATTSTFAALRTNGLGTWVLVLENGTILYSSDSGGTWATSGTSASASSSGIQMDCDGTTFAIADNIGVLHSTDGSSWTRVTPYNGVKAYTGICAMVDP